MASVSNDDPEVLVVGKLQRGRDVGGRGDVHGVRDVVAQSAWRILRGEGVACLVCEVRLHH